MASLAACLFVFIRFIILYLYVLAREEQGADFVVMPWDWSYYSNKLKDKKFNINEEMLRPYFELEQVKKGVFGLAR